MLKINIGLKEIQTFYKIYFVKLSSKLFHYLFLPPRTTVLTIKIYSVLFNTYLLFLKH